MKFNRTSQHAHALMSASCRELEICLTVLEGALRPRSGDAAESDFYVEEAPSALDDAREALETIRMALHRL